jgi:hypothetical protein
LKIVAKHRKVKGLILQTKCCDVTTPRTPSHTRMGTTGVYACMFFAGALETHPVNSLGGIDGMGSQLLMMVVALETESSRYFINASFPILCKNQLYHLSTNKEGFWRYALCCLSGSVLPIRNHT